MQNIKYILSIGLLLCAAAASAQQQFSAGRNRQFEVNRIKSDKSRKIEDKSEIGHLRQGVAPRTADLEFIKSVKADLYRRPNDSRGVKQGYGYSFQADMDFSGKQKMTAGFTKTDYRYYVLTYEKYPARQTLAAQPAGTLTGDPVIRGMSPFIPWKYKRSAYYRFLGYATMDTNKPTPLAFIYNADNFSFGVQFDVRNMLKKTHWS